MEHALRGERHDAEMAQGRVAYWEFSSTLANASETPVILIHGFRGDHHGLERVAEFTRSQRIIIPDLPGFGASERLSTGSQPREHTLENLGQWLKEFCVFVAHEPFVLVGHSFGTLVVAASLQQGNTPDRLVLINPISAPALEGPRGILSKLALWYYELGRLAPEAVSKLLLKSRLIVRVMSESMAKTKNMHLRAWIHEQHDQYFSGFSDTASLLESFRASISHTVHEYSSFFGVPTSIVAADRDDITPLAEQLRLHREIPDSTLTVIRNLGHLIHYEAPSEIGAVINEALASQKSVLR